MYAIPGGLIAVGTKVDPQFTRSDNMVGNIIGHPDSMPPVYIEIDVKTTMLRRVVGTRQDSNNKIDSLQEGETLLINIGSTSCGGNVMRVTGKQARILLTKFVCAEIGDKISLSRKMDRNFRLIGWGEIEAGHEEPNQR